MEVVLEGAHHHHHHDDPSSTEAEAPSPHAYVGRQVRKRFGKEYFGGVVAEVSIPNSGEEDEGIWWRIKYEDGDEEDLLYAEMAEILVPEKTSKKSKVLAQKEDNHLEAPVEAPKKTKKKRQAAAARPVSQAAQAASSGPAGSSDDTNGDFAAPSKRQRNNSSSRPKATAANEAPKAAPKAPPKAAPKAPPKAAKAPNKKPPAAAPGQERRAAGDNERPEELLLRNEMGIKLGETRRVHMPQPREVLLRHHADCKCWKCKKGIARGKVKGGGRRKEGGASSAKKASDPLKAPKAALKKAQKAADDCRCRICREPLVGEQPQDGSTSDGSPDAVTAPCGHSFCRGCLKAKLAPQVAAAQASKARARRAAASSSQLGCPKCGQGLGAWFKGDGDGIPRDHGVERRAREARAAVAKAEAALEEAEGDIKGNAKGPIFSLSGPLSPVREAETEGDEELQGQGPREEGQEEDEEAWDEEEDLPEDALLTGEKLLGKDWRSKCWWEERQVGRVHLAPPFADPTQMQLPQWEAHFDPNSKAEDKAKQEVEKAIGTFRRYMDISRENLLKDEMENGKFREDGKAKSKRPDLGAQTMMRNEGLFVGQKKGGPVPPPRPGTLPGMPVGTKFLTRAEMMVVGMHTHWLNGICSADVESKAGADKKSKAKYVIAIAMSGGYEDDQDGGEFCKYTGEGGNDMLHGGKQIADQEWTRGNLALANNSALGLPVRVIRKNMEADSYTKSSFVYDGLYYVHRYWQEVGVSGYYTCKFQLERVEDQVELMTASVHWRNQGGKALPQTQRAEDRPGFIMADLSLGQESVPICVVNEIDRRSEAWAPDPIPIRPSADPSKHPVEDAQWPSDPEKSALAFVYTTSQILSKSIPIPRMASPLSEKRLKELNGGSLPYNANGMALRQPFCTYEQVQEEGDAVAGPACSAQLGIRYRLELFRTQGKGWGVRSWDRIPVGAFVCEFTGEVLTEEESHQRLEEAEKQAAESAPVAASASDKELVRKKAEGLHNEYMFDLTIHGIPVYQHATGLPVPGQHDHEYLLDPSRQLDAEDNKKSAKMAMEQAGLTEGDVATVYHLDGKRAGSIARFINHNHTHPNLVIQPCLWDHHDPRLVRLCLFAAEDIPPLTELNYDYGEVYEQVMLEGASLPSLKMGSR